MVYAGKPEVAARIPGIATNEAAARGFVERLVLQTVFGIVERQARSALLPNSIISAILGQLTVKVIYAPMLCQDVLLGLADMTELEKKETRCIIVDNTVTAICINPMDAKAKCDTMKNVMAVNATHSTISGSIMTTNIIMAKWSRAMWQGVVNRAVRALAAGPFGSHFFAATATVGGN
ncbi:hypothetical protein KIN20_017817 [Parelaphostrongylus tenuis]|uniref:Uncharacterized protein n=1 Tax=Parelaphostrongylus tenuis TaxID=148309 RepID=A0AAD5N6R9_PARTN|nr:hypothetical protein KIN20_017817 [Parelaphostrongylus tenuis]